MIIFDKPKLMTKIEKLTTEQEQQMVSFREEWRKHGLSTDCVDAEKTKESISEMYRLIGKEPPIFIFCPSLIFARFQIAYCREILPEIFKNKNLRANLGANLGDNLRANLGDNLRANLGDNLRANLGANLWANLRANLGANLRDNLRANLGANLRANLGANLWANLRANLGANLRANLRDNLRANLGANLWANLRDNLRANLWANLWANLGANLGANLWANLWANLEKNLKKDEPTDFWGSMDAFWIAFYEYPEKFLGVKYEIEQSKKLKLWSDLAKSCSWFWCYENYCFVSDRPKEIHMNENKLLHKTDGPAISWIDGYEIFYINGREMPRWVFDKVKEGSITKEDFINEQNEDIKAGIYEVIESKGEGFMLEFLGAKEIDRKTFVHANGELEEMVLYRTIEKFNEEEDLNGNSPAPLAWLKMSCPSTSQNYLIPTDGSFETCEAAAKFARPSDVPKELDYTWHQRN